MFHITLTIIIVRQIVQYNFEFITRRKTRKLLLILIAIIIVIFTVIIVVYVILSFEVNFSTSFLMDDKGVCNKTI